MTLLTVNSITKRFGGLDAVKSLDLTVEKGEIVGMIGPNGAGKTTAFNMISGYYKPNEGRIFFNGEDITGKRPDEICKKGLARTFQIVKPFPDLTVIDNVTIGSLNHEKDLRSARLRAAEILEFLQLGQSANKLASSLPIASRKRLEIARALATEPKIILLDEVMAGLRPTETEEMIELIRAISKNGIALLLVEHVMRVIMALADRVVVLHHGMKIADGIPGIIVKDKRVIEAYLGEIQTDVTN